MADLGWYEKRPRLIPVAMAVWFGAVGFACFAGVEHVIGLPMTGGDWRAIALMTGAGVLAGVAAAIVNGRVRSAG